MLRLDLKLKRKPEEVVVVYSICRELLRVLPPFARYSSFLRCYQAFFWSFACSVFSVNTIGIHKGLVSQSIASYLGRLAVVSLSPSISYCSMPYPIVMPFVLTSYRVSIASPSVRDELELCAWFSSPRYPQTRCCSSTG